MPPPELAAWEPCGSEEGFEVVRARSREPYPPDPHRLAEVLALPPPELTWQLAQWERDAGAEEYALRVPTLRALARLRGPERDAMRDALLSAIGRQSYPSRERFAALAAVDRERLPSVLEGVRWMDPARAALASFPDTRAMVAELARLGLVSRSLEHVGLIDVIAALERDERMTWVDVEGGLHGGHALEALIAIVADDLRGVGYSVALPEGEGRITLRDRASCAQFRIPLTRGDWFDLQSVLDALNATLHRRGAQRRLFALRGGQVYDVIAGPPASLASLAERGLLPPLARIPNENARMLGIEADVLRALDASPEPP